MAVGTIYYLFNPFTESRISLGDIFSDDDSLENGGPLCPVYFDGELACHARFKYRSDDLLLSDVDEDVMRELKQYVSRLAPMTLSFMDLSYSLDIVITAVLHAREFKRVVTENSPKGVCFTKVGDALGKFGLLPSSADDVDMVAAVLDLKFGSDGWLMLGNPRDGERIPLGYYGQTSWAMRDPLV